MALLNIGSLLNGTAQNSVLDLGVVANLPGVVSLDGAVDVLTPAGTALNVDADLQLLSGTDVGDVLDAVLGGGLIFGQDGNDTLNGNAGNDVMDGGSGDDTLLGGPGNDTLLGAGGNDFIDGGSGDDLIFGGRGSDTIVGNGGQDTVFGGQDADLINYTVSPDRAILLGNMGNDLIYGGSGADTIFGGQDEDRIFGGGGDDIINGDLGNDIITGGSGADRFVFNNPINGLLSGSDRITDFNAGTGDRLALNGQSYFLSSDASGNAVLTLSGGGNVTLEGVAAGSVQSSWFA
ncbi:calcium-binding protein [Methylobacterium hispanicum]|uniref:calcium-binding protein n=1 Tax=Methylobacterium hispanicum TaxID=270350 RepID=UPI002F35DAD3